MSDACHYVYKLAYPEPMGGHVFYVGKGTGDRIDEHERETRRGVQSYKCNVIRKIWMHGEEVIKKKVALFETHEEALLYEIALVMLMRPYGHLANLTDGGDGIYGLVRTEEHRRKISQSHKGITHTEEARRKISLAQKGKVLSVEIRQKMSESRKGRIHSEETRHKISTGNKGKPRSEETRRKLSERTTSEETRRKLSIAHKGNPGIPRSEETRHKISVKNKGRLVGRTLSAETRRKISVAGIGKKRQPHTEEARRKISEGLTGKTLSTKTRQKLKETTKAYHARRREQALQAMREPIISPTDADWKQGIAPLSLWETTDAGS